MLSRNKEKDMTIEFRKKLFVLAVILIHADSQTVHCCLLRQDRRTLSQTGLQSTHMNSFDHL